MTDTLDLLKLRRSVPPQGLAGPGPSSKEIETLLRVASRVPDHGKLAPWRFILFEGDERLRIGDVIATAFRADAPGADDGRVALERGRLARAPLVVAVVSRARLHAKIPVWEQELSAGAVCMALVIAAQAMGFASSWLTEWIAYDRRVLDAMGLAPDERMAGFVHIGRAATLPPDRDRPELAAIVSRYQG
ncbi:nitroreductase family protein [Chelatococcus reniformis]|uniref:Putative NAD(P)H nitroreductase n=1 Tax=Chelatococcus reniformis TaxID=1494448 RepID=A0A916XHY1_9HYPH|nr:nitroreductase [Chelatococcus reniformis]GGC71737.1 nitroreductase [Chelatococcus reniformis]